MINPITSIMTEHRLNNPIQSVRDWTVKIYDEDYATYGLDLQKRTSFYLVLAIQRLLGHKI